VPPPPVSGGAVGKVGLTDADVRMGATVEVGVAGTLVWLPGGATELDELAEAEEVGACDEGEVGACDEAEEACDEARVDAPPAPLVWVAAREDVDPPPPVGEGVRVPALDDECPLVCGDGTDTEGTGELLPPPLQAETATARRTAPAAERPAISHAPWAVTDGVRRIFMNPPRMRVR